MNKFFKKIMLLNLISTVALLHGVYEKYDEGLLLKFLHCDVFPKGGDLSAYLSFDYTKSTSTDQLVKEFQRKNELPGNAEQEGADYTLNLNSDIQYALLECYFKVVRKAEWNDGDWLVEALRADRFDMFKLFLDFGLDHNGFFWVKDHSIYPIEVAVEENRVEAVKLLLEKDIPQAHINKAIEIAIKQNNSGLVNLLSKNNALPEMIETRVEEKSVGSVNTIRIRNSTKRIRKAIVSTLDALNSSLAQNITENNSVALEDLSLSPEVACEIQQALGEFKEATIEEGKTTDKPFDDVPNDDTPDSSVDDQDEVNKTDEQISSGINPFFVTSVVSSSIVGGIYLVIKEFNKFKRNRRFKGQRLPLKEKSCKP